MKRALVTGGSGAIGAAICERLAAEGFEVLVHANNGIARAEAVVARIHTAGGTARAVCFDLADFAATDQAIAELMDEDHPIQVLVNNAGIHDDAPPRHWRRNALRGACSSMRLHPGSSNRP